MEQNLDVLSLAVQNRDPILAARIGHVRPQVTGYKAAMPEADREATWDWRRVQALARDAPQAEGVSSWAEQQSQEPLKCHL